MVGLNNYFNRPEAYPASIPLPEVIGRRGSCSGTAGFDSHHHKRQSPTSGVRRAIPAGSVCPLGRLGITRIPRDGAPRQALAKQYIRYEKSPFCIARYSPEPSEAVASRATPRRYAGSRRAIGSGVRCARAQLARIPAFTMPLCRWELPAPLARGPLCILVCMARLNVYVPDQLAEQARSRGLNVSALTQAAIVEELERTSLSAWLDSLPSISRSVNHDAVLAAVDDARDESGR